jgi:hypothetical protein
MSLEKTQMLRMREPACLDVPAGDAWLLNP